MHRHIIIGVFLGTLSVTLLIIDAFIDSINLIKLIGYNVHNFQINANACVQDNKLLLCFRNS